MIGMLLFLAALALCLVGIFFTFARRSTNPKRESPIEFAFVPLGGLKWFALSFVLFFFSYAIDGFVSIDAGSVGIVKKWGEPVRTLDPGLHYIIPIAESVTPVATQTRIVKPNENASSKDLQVVYTEVTLAYHVDPAFASYVLVKFNNDAETRLINPAILESIKRATAKYDANELIAKRPQVRDDIEDFVKQRLASEHIIAESTYITNFSFSKEYEQAIENKQVAQQKAEQATNDLNRIKIEADQRVAKAQAEATELRLQAAQITASTIQLRMIEKWDGHLPSVVTGSGTVPMMDVLAGKK